MDDADLQRIRAARLAELQSSAPSGPVRAAGAGAAGGQGQKNSSGEDEDAQRHAQLSQILDTGARDRLRRIALVKPDRARSVEDLILRMMRSGQIRQRVKEAELVGLLQEIAEQQEQERTTSSIRNLRRDESDDDWD